MSTNHCNTTLIYHPHIPCKTQMQISRC